MTSRGLFVCSGTVVHERSDAASTRFRYRMASYLFDVDAIARVRGPVTWLLGVDRPRPVQVRTTDYLRTEHGDTLRARAIACLERHGVDTTDVGRIQLHTGARVLGYGFNPVSVWLCRTSDGAPLAAIADVNNTYGEAHPYVLTREEQSPDALERGEWRAQRDKQFHVSPFLELKMGYDIRLRWPGPTRRQPLVFDVAVRREGAERPMFRAVQVAHPRPLSLASLLVTQLRHPLMPQRTMALIHLQALRVWRKGARFTRKPPWIPQRGSFAEHPTGDTP